MTGIGRRDDDRARVRDALRRAPGALEPDMTRLVDAVPHLMVEARERRAVTPAGWAPIVSARARRAMPKLAAATAAAVVLAIVATFVGGTPADDEATSVESVILGDTVDSDGDVLLDMILGQEQDHV